MNKKITVKGVGNVSIKPDFVVVLITIKAQDLEYDKAMSLSNQRLKELSTSLSKAGFKKKDIKTTDFIVDLAYTQRPDKQGNYQQVFNGFICKHNLKVSFDFKMEKLSEVFSLISESLAQPELRVNFTVKNPNKVSEKLLKVATKNAFQKAEILSKASNVSLGDLISIDYNWTEQNYYSNTSFNPSNPQLMNRSLQTSKILEIEPDNIQVTDSATFIWEII